jgi:ubiquinol-cytochrome c reductase iron-sulfur subunit
MSEEQRSASSPSATPEEAQHAAKAAKHEAEAGAVLLLGGVVAWKIGESLLRRIGRWFFSGAGELRGKPGTTTMDIAAVASQKKPQALEEVRRDKPAAIEDPVERARRERQEDRNLDAEAGINVARRERWGTGVIALAIAAFVAGGVGFVVAYWTGGSNQLLGGMLAFFFGGLGIALVGWGRWLTLQKEATEKRELPSSPEEHEAAATTFEIGARDIQRRRLLGWLAAGGASLFGAMVISLFRSLGGSPNPALYTRVWKRGQRLMTLDGKPVSVNALTPGSTTIVFPEDSIGSEKTQTVLVKVDPQLLRLPQDRANWAPLGNLAFSRVCTHAGCSVGMYEATSHQLMCPCHQSTFDVLRGAEPTSGPAARPLPQLPLCADSDGNLCAAGGFTQPPGPGFWGIPS